MEKLFLTGKFVLSCKIKLLTGLHIGSGSQALEIGGIDNPVIKDAVGRPYIPGSSLKGKMRALMEFYHKKVEAKNIVNIGTKNNQIRIHICDDEDCEVCNLFGRNHGTHFIVQTLNSDNTNREDFNKHVIPTRLIVRDAYLVPESITDEMRENLDMIYTETKSENSIDRITSAANPRTNERVPASACFNVEFVLNQFEVVNGKVKPDGSKYLKELITAMKLLENDYLGGSGSRGYGKIAFKDITIEYRGKDYYENSAKPKSLSYEKLEDLKVEELDKLLA